MNEWRVLCAGSTEDLRKTTGTTESVLYGNLRRKDSVRRKPPLREDLNAEAEESPLLQPLTRGTAGEDTAGWKRLSVCCGDL
jgi:hypothetical protein